MSVEKELGELRAAASFTADAVREIKGSLERAASIVERNTQAHHEFREFMVKSIGEINEKIVFLPDYKKRCELDRKDLDARIRALEVWRSRQRGAVGMLTVVVFLLGGMIQAFTNLFGQITRH